MLDAREKWHDFCVIILLHTFGTLAMMHNTSELKLCTIKRDPQYLGGRGKNHCEKKN